MASAAEQLAANLSYSTFSKATDLKKRILVHSDCADWWSIALGTYIPVPGINPGPAWLRRFPSRARAFSAW